MAGNGTTTRRSRLLDWLDALAKLLGAAAILVVAVLANSLQSKLTGISIQSQREQAESQLRASMFNSLINPIIGSQTDGKPIPADRERLLAELLVLNFNENIELKPLLEDASARLAVEAPSKKNTAANLTDPREPLWSVARRIAERQKASIAWEWAAYKTSQGAKTQGLAFLLGPWWAPAQASSSGCEVYFLTVDTSPRNSEIVKAGPSCQFAAALRDIVDLKSPDGNYTLRLVLANPDWNNQAVKVSVQPFLSSQENPNPADPTYAFALGWLDLPLTDNTLLSDGNRFAIYLRTLDSQLEKLTVALMWFPKGYFTPRERPLNYRQVQELLGKKLQ
jgi:hypothetical protein